MSETYLAPSFLFGPDLKGFVLRTTVIMLPSVVVPTSFLCSFTSIPVDPPDSGGSGGSAGEFREGTDVLQKLILRAISGKMKAKMVHAPWTTVNELTIHTTLGVWFFCVYSILFYIRSIYCMVFI